MSFFLQLIMTDPKPLSYTDMFSSRNTIIGISGIIGVGKSTLTKSIGEQLGYTSYFEPVKENIFLEKFYKDMKKYSFPMQMYLLNKRFEQHQKMVWMKENAIQDRTIYEDVIFAKMLYEGGYMEKDVFQTYRDTFESMTHFLHRPDMIIYLDVKPEIALERIKKRSRGCETTITLEYLQALQKGYEEWIQDIHPRIPVIRIDWNTFKDTKDVLQIIEKYKGKQYQKGIVV